LIVGVRRRRRRRRTLRWGEISFGAPNRL